MAHPGSDTPTEISGSGISSGVPNALLVDGATTPDGVLLDSVLHDVCTDGPPPIEVVVSILAQLCDALGFSHDRGRAHGDVRPGRLLLARTGRLHVFGAGSEHGIARQHNYAALEFDVGAGADATADVFSVGVIAYELLTGRPLFGDHMDRELRACIATRLTPPSVYNADCPAPLDALVLRALAPEPAQRWASARDMHDALCLLGRPAPGAVARWLAGGQDSPLVTYALTFTPPATKVPPPPPPLRLPRGSAAELPRANELARDVANMSVHDVATQIQPRAARVFPLAPAPELNDVFESLDADAPVMPLATPAEMMAPVLANEPELGQRAAPAPRYLALGLSFVAGAVTLYLLLLLFGC